MLCFASFFRHTEAKSETSGHEHFNRKSRCSIVYHFLRMPLLDDICWSWILDETEQKWRKYHNSFGRLVNPLRSVLWWPLCPSYGHFLPEFKSFRSEKYLNDDTMCWLFLLNPVSCELQLYKTFGYLMIFYSIFALFHISRNKTNIASVLCSASIYHRPNENRKIWLN